MCADTQDVGRHGHKCLQECWQKRVHEQSDFDKHLGVYVCIMCVGHACIRMVLAGEQVSTEDLSMNETVIMTEEHQSGTQASLETTMNDDTNHDCEVIFRPNSRLCMRACGC